MPVPLTTPSKPIMVDKCIQTNYTFGSSEQPGSEGGYYTSLDGYPKEYSSEFVRDTAQEYPEVDAHIVEAEISKARREGSVVTRPYKRKIWKWKWISNDAYEWFIEDAEESRGSFPNQVR